MGLIPTTRLPFRGARRVTLSLALLPLVLACGSSASYPLGSARRSGASGPARRVVELTGPRLGRYETDARPSPLVVPALGASAPRLRADDVEASLRPGLGALVVDARLAELGAALVPELAGVAEPPPHEVIDFLARPLGLPDPTFEVEVVGASDGSLAAHGLELLGGMSQEGRVGVGLGRRGDLDVLVLVRARGGVELTSDLAEALAGGASVRLRGALTEGLRNPLVAISRPDGRVERIPAGSGPAFDLNLRFAAAGTHRLEIMGEGAQGPVVVLNVPLYVGVDPPQRLEIEPSARTAGGADEVQAALYRLLTESRARAQLAPLTRHPGAEAVARGHSEDMQRSGFVAHRSPTTGELSDRFGAAGIRTGLALENVARGYSAEEIHRGLLASPAHRSAILNPDVNQVGIGVVLEPEGERAAYLVTQVFLRVYDAVDVAGAPAMLLERINAGRAARGASALDADPNLQAAAQEAAEAFFADPELGQRQVVDQANESLRRFSIAFRRVQGLMVVVGNPEEASRLEPTFEPELRYAGIGVAQGNRPDVPPNSVAVVMLLAWAR